MIGTIFWYCIRTMLWRKVGRHFIYKIINKDQFNRHYREKVELHTLYLILQLHMWPDLWSALICCGGMREKCNNSTDVAVLFHKNAHDDFLITRTKHRLHDRLQIPQWRNCTGWSACSVRVTIHGPTKACEGLFLLIYFRHLVACGCGEHWNLYWYTTRH